MFIQQLQSKNNDQIELFLSGDNFISKFILIFSVLCKGTTKLYNFSFSNDNIDLINILKQFNIKINFLENNILEIEGINFYNLTNSVNIINVKSSKENFLFLMILLANQNFKTFITGDDNFVKNDFSYLFNYLNNINLVFNTESKMPLLLYGKKDFLDKNHFEVSETLDKNLLLLTSLFNKKNVNIIDNNLKEEYIENIFSYYNIDFYEKYFENTNFFSREVKRCKEINIKKNNKSTLVIEAQDFEIPVNIKETVYTIFLFLILDKEELVLRNIAINELNDTIFKVLIDNGVNIYFKNQKILNKIKVSDIIVKKSNLKPLFLSKERVGKILDYYLLLIMLNIVKNNSFNIINLKYIKEFDNDNYTINFVKKEFDINFIENKERLEFVANKNIILDNKKNINFYNNKNINSNIVLMLTICIASKNEQFIIDSKKEDLIQIFPNLLKVFKQFDLVIND